MKQEVLLTLDQNNSTVINLFGATVVSWVSNGVERLFVSSKAVFDNKKAIRGGIPVVFPHFGPWDLGPQHGFARISEWQLHTPPQPVGDGSIQAVFSLSSNSTTRAMWNYDFTLLYKVTLTRCSLSTALEICNTGSGPFDFTALLHTYVRVNDINSTRVSNLSGLQYFDKLQGGQLVLEQHEQVSVLGGADRIYLNSPASHRVTDHSAGIAIDVTKDNLPDTVLWNPWSENAAKMADFGADEYNIMICVEPGCVGKPVALQPEESITVSQLLTVVIV